MEVGIPYERAEIAGVVSDDDPIFVQTAAQDEVIGLTQTSDVPRMHRVDPLRRKAMCKPGRKALINEEPH